MAVSRGVGRAGSGTAGNVQVDGLAEFQREMRKVAPEVNKATQRIHKKWAVMVQTRAQGIAGRMPGGRHFRRLIRASGTQRGAALRYKATGHEAAMGWLRGSKRFGQFLRWTGNQHESGFGDFGRESYAISPAIAETIPKIIKEYDKQVARALALAYPGGSSR